VVRSAATAAAGFLLAVLWFDLMFDVQARRRTDEAVESIATYYARVTRAARPMNRLVALVMLALLASLVAEVTGDDVPAWAAWTSLVLAIVPIGLAGTTTVPAAVRLGQRTDPPDVRQRAALHILRQHVVCAVFIAAVLGVQLTSA
jgi:hypothetical protein